jgi:DNA-binding SARP family transcriptional activator
MHLLRTLGELSLFRLEGDQEVEVVSGSKTLLIPAWLATRPGRSARREDLAEFLWPDQERAGALRALRQALFFLSRHAGDLFDKDDEVVALTADRLRVDSLEFDEAVRQEDYRRALELHRGRFASGLERRVGVEVEHWIEEQNARISVAIEVAYAHLISEATSTGNQADAEQLARKFLDDNPSDENRHQVLIRTLKAIGSEVAALRAFEAYRTMVDREEGEQLPGDLERTMERLRAELTAPRFTEMPPVMGELREFPDHQGAPQTLRLRLALVGALGLVLVLTGILLRSRPAGLDTLAGVRASFLVATEVDGVEGFQEITIRGGRFDVREAGPTTPHYAVPGPIGAVVAYAEEASDGWNVAVREGQRVKRTLTSFPGDEFPLGWSPDGRYLLITRVRLDASNRSRIHTLHFFDLAGDSLHTITALTSTEWPTASWSPDGSQIAFTADVAGSPDIFVVDFDGGNLKNLTHHPGHDRSPAWAPDRSAIAFVSSREGGADLYLVRPDGSDIQQVTKLTRDEALPMWLSPTALLFLAGGDQPEFWTLDVAGGRATRIEPAPRITGVAALGRVEPTWLERLRILPQPDIGSPGQHMALVVEALGPRGDQVGFGPVPMRWTSRDTSVARIGPDGALELTGEGTARVVVSAGGWRTDSLLLPVLPLRISEIEPVFEEQWNHGLDTTRWHPIGEPGPELRSRGGGIDGLAFANNGDAFFESGAVTVERFDLRPGLTVEVEGRVPFTGQLHQVFGFQLVPESTSDSVLAYGRASPIVGIRLTGPSDGSGGETAIVTATGKHLLPMPRGVGSWRSYVLQVTAKGVVQFLIDGRLYWQAADPLPVGHLTTAQLALGFSSVGTRILHGTVRVYSAQKYRLPDPPNTPQN